MDIRWLSLFADVPAARVPAAGRFWTAVTGAARGDGTGEAGEYLPLVPADGDGYLWLQRIGSDTPGWHLDLHVPDVASAADAAERLGAAPVRRVSGLVTFMSPAGQPFCLVAEEPARRRHRPAPTVSSAGRSLVDQLCFDIPAGAFEAECAFWSELTGWPRAGADLQEFDRLTVPAELPLRVLLQRLGPDDAGPPRGHADLSADVRSEEVARHAGLGAEVVRVAEHWTTLRDPAGLLYCVTDRRPKVA